VLTSNRLPAAASVSTLRGGVITAARGATAASTMGGGPSRRKLRDAAATDALRRAEEIVSAALRADQAQIADGERLARQLIAHALRKRVMTEEMLRRRQLEAIWRLFLADPEIFWLTSTVPRVTAVPPLGGAASVTAGAPA